MWVAMYRFCHLLDDKSDKWKVAEALLAVGLCCAVPLAVALPVAVVLAVAFAVPLPVALAVAVAIALAVTLAIAFSITLAVALRWLDWCGMPILGGRGRGR